MEPHVELTQPCNITGKLSTVLPVLTIGAARDPNAAPQGSVCCVCKRETSQDDPEVAGRHWHLKCFQCDLCKEHFSHGSYILHGRYVLHKSCYCHLFSPRCFVCAGVLAEFPVVRALGHLYHASCFSCTRCNTTISFSATFHSVDGLPVCSECYQREQTVCLRCHQLMTDGYIRFLFRGRLYHMHRSCARCDECRVRLNQDNFACEQGTAVCRKCWTRAMTRQCDACQEPILAKDFVQFHGHWHKKCFKCQVCKTSLSYVRPEVHNGTLICERCETGIATHCGVCGRVIIGDKEEAHGRVFHHECFTCSVCRRAIGTDECEFTRGELHCANCLTK